MTSRRNNSRSPNGGGFVSRIPHGKDGSELRPGRWRLNLTNGLSLDVDRRDMIDTGDFTFAPTGFSWDEPSLHLSAHGGEFVKVAQGTTVAKRPTGRIRRIRRLKILD